MAFAQHVLQATTKPVPANALSAQLTVKHAGLQLVYVQPVILDTTSQMMISVILKLPTVILETVTTPPLPSLIVRDVLWTML